jgi:hypothetical protein
MFRHIGKWWWLYIAGYIVSRLLLRIIVRYFGVYY